MTDFYQVTDITEKQVTAFDQPSEIISGRESQQTTSVEEAGAHKTTQVHFARGPPSAWLAVQCKQTKH